MCAYGGIQEKGGPRSSHDFAFSKILSTIYVYGDGNTTCVHTRNSIKKVLHKCYTGFWTRNYSSDSKFDYNQFQQVDIFIGVQSYPEGGSMGRIRMKNQKAISIQKYYTCRTAHSWKLFSLSVQEVENISTKITTSSAQ